MSVSEKHEANLFKCAETHLIVHEETQNREFSGVAVWHPSDLLVFNISHTKVHTLTFLRISTHLFCPSLEVPVAYRLLTL